MTFTHKLEEALQNSESCLCIGLDPNISRIPNAIKEEHKNLENQVFQFLKAVINETSKHCAAYKPNLGFFEALGPQGLLIFQQVLDEIPNDKIIIADAKRGDISSTAEHYARAYFEVFDVDAVTLNPLMGFETLNPFLNDSQKAIFVLTLTSNSGTDDFLAQPFANQNSMAEYIAQKLSHINAENPTEVGMVVGATQARELKEIIAHHPKSALLIPGIGTQGGSIDGLKNVLDNHQGIPLINSSRSILYAGENSDRWKQEIANQAAEYKKALQPITKQYV